MRVDYSKLFAKLKGENIRQKDFREQARISSGTMQHMLHNESITVDSICKICDYLHCMPDDIMEFIPEKTFPVYIQAKQQAKIDALQKQLDALKKEVNHD